MDHHFIDDQAPPRHERELTLSTGSILAIFLGLAVLCGGFFGFGYNMGRKSAPTPLNLSEIATDPSLPSTGAAKPPAGSPLDTSAANPVVTTPAAKPVRRTPPPASVSTDDEEAPSPEAKQPASSRPEVAIPTPAPVVRPPAPVSATPVSPAALNPSVTSAASGSFVVQVAAVTHKDDADLLVGALRARGYAVSTRSSAADSFIHIQIGPFRDKKEADAMRQKLLTDGYNAIVKQ